MDTQKAYSTCEFSVTSWIVQLLTANDVQWWARFRGARVRRTKRAVTPIIHCTRAEDLSRSSSEHLHHTGTADSTSTLVCRGTTSLTSMNVRSKLSCFWASNTVMSCCPSKPAVEPPSYPDLFQPPCPRPIRLDGRKRQVRSHGLTTWWFSSTYYTSYRSCRPRR